MYITPASSRKVIANLTAISIFLPLNLADWQTSLGQIVCITNNSLFNEVRDKPCENRNSKLPTSLVLAINVSRRRRFDGWRSRGRFFVGILLVMANLRVCEVANVHSQQEQHKTMNMDCLHPTPRPSTSSSTISSTGRICTRKRGTRGYYNVFRVKYSDICSRQTK